MQEFCLSYLLLLGGFEARTPLLMVLFWQRFYRSFAKSPGEEEEEELEEVRIGVSHTGNGICCSVLGLSV